MLSIQEELLMDIRVRAIREKTNLSALTEKLYGKYLRKIEKKRGRKASQ